MDNNEEVEDSTKYGEFISSFDRWLTPEEQKRKAKKLEQITDVAPRQNKQL